MKKTIITIAVAITSILLISEAKAQVIEGGHIDTEKGEISIVQKVSSRTSILVSTSKPILEHNEKGRIIIVYPTGRYRETSNLVRDRLGTVIRPSSDMMDKVIYIDQNGTIIGGAGLNQMDIIQIMSKHRSTFGMLDRSILEMTQPETLLPKLTAVKNAVEVFDSDLNQDDQKALFRVSLEMQAGRTFAGLVHKIIDCFDNYEEASNIGRSVDDLVPLSSGIFSAESVAYGKNGGFDSVAYGKNGGFDSEASVSYGKNGGFDSVAYGKNGGFDSQASVSYGKNGGFDSEASVSYGKNGGFDSVAYGKNGGFDSVSYGKNGGFDSEASVSYGKNGGFDSQDSVSYGKNGGFDSQAIIQGWSIDPDVKDLPDTDLNLNGSLIMLLK